MNSREDHLLKLPFFDAFFLPIFEGQWTDPPEGEAPPVSCSVSQSSARKVLKLPIYLKRKCSEVQGKDAEVGVLDTREATCTCQP